MQTAMDSSAAAAAAASAVAALPPSAAVVAALSHSNLSSVIGSNGAGSCSTSSSSASSGYGSATTTPTTPLSSHYDAASSSHASPTPMATIATVAPFYSEALTMDAQQRHQQQQQHLLHQQQQQQQQLPQSQPHYYHSSYNYGNTLPLDYNAYNAYTPTAGNTGVHQSRSYEKSMLKHAAQSQQVAPLFNAGGNNNNHNNANAKPQAAATPFYAQPTAGSYGNSPHYDPYKMAVKLPATGVGTSPEISSSGGSVYGNSYMSNYPASPQSQQSPNQRLPSQSLQQQQSQQAQQNQMPLSMQQYHNVANASPKQQQLSSLEPNYAAIKPSSRYQNLAAPIYGSSATGSGISSAAGSNASYYDKYAMYNPNGGLSYAGGNAATLAPPLSHAPLYNPELPAEAYRKSGNTCHWSVDYAAAANYRSNANYHAHHLAAAPGTNSELYYSGKYKEYAAPGPAPYPNPYQPNMTQPFATRTMWPADNPLSMQSYATAAPQLAAGSNAAAPPNARQSCCSQPYGQQSCYYPRSNGYGPGAVPPPYGNPQTAAAPQYAVNKHGEYAAMPMAQNMGPAKLKHPSDLYVSHAPYEVQATPAQLGYSYATAGNNGNQRFMPNQMGMEPSAAYYNDLNNLDNYANMQAAQQQQQTHLPPANRQAYVNPGKPTSLLEYRKRQMPASNCYMGQSAPLSNLEAHVGSYASYGMHGNNANQSHYGIEVGKPATSNIRDFLSSWNDDEEELIGSADTEAQPVAVVAPVVNNFVYDPLPPAGPAATAVVEQTSQAELNPYQPMNLPDIIIDIEKSNGNVVSAVDDSFGSFDVEKELDELRLRKTSFVPTEAVEATNDEFAKMLSVPEAAEPISMKMGEAKTAQEQTIPLQELSAVAAEAQSVEFDNTSNSNESTFEKEYETFIHKIGGSGSETETNAQDDSEYKEHAKKFKFYKRKRKNTEGNGEEATLEDLPSLEKQLKMVEDSLPIVQEVEEAQQVQEVQEIITPVLSSAETARANRKLSARRRRNRIKMMQILEFESPKIKHRYYFKALKLLRRRFALSQMKQDRTQLMRKNLALRKERRLPLIKRQSAKQFAAEKQPKLYNPASLKILSVSVVNSKDFQAKLLQQSSTEPQLRTETVIKTVPAARESNDYEQEKKLQLSDNSCNKTEEATEPQMKTEQRKEAAEEALINVPETSKISICLLEERSMDSSCSLESVEMLGSFKGFDDVENINLSPQAKLHAEELQVQPVELQKPKQLEIQEWLHNNMVEQAQDLTLTDQEKAANEQPSLQECAAIARSNAGTTLSSSSSSSGDNDESSSSSSGESCSSSSSSSTSSEESEFNELAALQKELSQHTQTATKGVLNVSAAVENATKAATVATAADTSTQEQVSNNDIAKLKQILESDGEEPEPEPSSSCNTPVTVPKLSDLSKIALNSSLKSSDLVIKFNEDDELMERELSVEDALAAMYQQIPSDPEDYNSDDVNKSVAEGAVAGQDLLLINLAEMFDNSSDLYMVQCDMNENILGVLSSDDETAAQTEQVNTLQLIELLAEAEPETELQLEAEPAHTAPFDSTPMIHHEEIVPDNYIEFEKRQFLKYLHSKYVQGHISKFYHAQRVIKKYKRRLWRKRQLATKPTNGRA